MHDLVNAPPGGTPARPAMLLVPRDRLARPWA